MNSNGRSSKPPSLSASATLSIPRWIWGRWPVPTFVTRCTHKQVEGSTAKGESLLCGGTPVEGKGAFYPPTVLSGVTEGMPAFDEETFGPVAALTRVPDIDA